MDLLASLGLEELPEQQTRTLHLISGENPEEFNLNLGFDACCTCGNKLTTTSVECPACRRVQYCSNSCRHEDAQVTASLTEDTESGEEDRALGHTSVICALLNLCHNDEAVERNIEAGDPAALQAAKDRVRSEYESYPATLANVLSQGPCFQATLKDCSKKSPSSLAVHVIGASDEAELWSDLTDLREIVWEAYAEALSELMETLRFDKIELFFVGPDCPPENLSCTRPVQSTNKERALGDLVIRTCRGDYNSEVLERHSIPEPDIVVFFNPGFTVPEYDWKESVLSIKRGTPFLLTTNTELEGIADCQYLLDQDRIQTMPPGLADMFGLYSPGDEEGEEEAKLGSASFFSENPFSGSRVRQSGTMANDVFVKNRWMLGGILDKFDPSSKEDLPSKRQRKSGESNTKADNPALV